MKNIPNNKLNLATLLLLSLTTSTAFATNDTTDTTDDPAKAGTGTNSIVLNTGTASAEATITSNRQTVDGQYSAAVGGYQNAVSGQMSGVFAGTGNIIKTTDRNNGIFAGQSNKIDTGAEERNTIIGGINHQITSGYDNFIIGGGDSEENSGGNINNGYNNNGIMGGALNTVEESAVNTMIVGGNHNTVSNKNSAIVGGNWHKAEGKKAAIVGGYWSEAKGKDSATIGGERLITKGTHSVILGGHTNTTETAGNYSGILGGYKNTTSGEYSTIIGGKFNVATQLNSVVAGGDQNKANGVDSGVFAGTVNDAQGKYSVVAGGWDNTAKDQSSGVFAGQNSIANGLGAVVVGGSDWTDSKGVRRRNEANFRGAGVFAGQANHAENWDSVVLGGWSNTTSSDFSAILAGYMNETKGQNAVVVGGHLNVASGKDSVVLGGGKGDAYKNTVTDADIIEGNKAIGERAGVLVGYQNTASGSDSVVVGGHTNKAEAANSAIIGGMNGSIKSNAESSVILGGGKEGKNVMEGVESAILAGHGHKIEGSGTNTSAIIAGRLHTVKADDAVIIGGGQNNEGGSTVDTGGENSVIAGGYGHKANGLNTGIMGGYNNKTESGNNTGFLGGHDNTITKGESAIIGGSSNSITAENGVILGGKSNVVSAYGGVAGGTKSVAGGKNSFAFGGADGTGNQAMGINSAVLAGNKNSTTAKDSVVFGGFNNNITGGAKNFILGGKNNTVSADLSGAIGGEGNNISGTKSYAIGSSNTLKSTIDYVFGESNNIAGSHNYIMGSNNTSTGEKVYILGSGVDTKGVANAVVLGDGSTAVADAVSVGTESAPRNIKHVKDGVISDDSLDAINGSQVTTVESATPTEISVTLDTTKTDHKHYKVGLNKAFKDKIDKIAKEMPEKLTEKGLKSSLTGDITSTGGTVTVTGGNDKLFTNVNLEVANGAITEDKLSAPLKTKLSKIPTVADIVSTDLTVSNDGDLKKGNVKLGIADGAIKMKHLGQDVKDAINLASNITINNNNDAIGKDKKDAVTGGVIHNYLTQNYYDINKVDDLLDKKVDKSAMKHSMTSQTLAITGGDEQFLKDITIEVKDGSITKNKLSKALKDEIDGKISKTDIHNIKSSTLTITGGGANNEGNVANGDVNIEITNGSITADKLDKNLKEKINGKLSKGDLINSTTVVLTEKDGKTEFSVADGSIGEKQLDTATNNQLKRVGSGFVKSGDNNTITGNVAYDAIKHAKTKVSTTGNYLTLKKTETEDVEPNSYEIGLDKDALKKDLAIGSITGTGITVEGGDNSTFKDVKLAIADNAITTAKVADNAITEDKISDEAVKKFTEKSRETVVAGSDALSVTPKTVAPNTDNQEFVVDLSVKTKATLQQVDTNKTNIANNTTNIATNKTEIAKKVNTVDMNGELTSQSITVTGEGKDKLLKDVNIEVNKTLTNMESISFNNGVSISGNGWNNAGKKVTNVADGKISPDSTDAINGRQLHALATGLGENLANVRAGLMDEIDDLKAGIAGSNAIALLGQARNSGDRAVSAGVGFYRNKAAFAVGASAWSDNGRWLLKGAVSMDSSKNVGGGASVTYNW